ncbi:helix-turn-helix transcriptional regulator [Acidovorax sp. SUPP3334]|uniref:helix-turn-helix domain-containing protein n=1 Tax=Acidovorax sp. SUPP3334 TaxID=2920881 RepID=UPI0023DE2729|nr:helix-turn-helix transcriptional regulator [Acidovorax sp. SUPP3334]GKT22566.1 helix-turn-helix domain-containing protein [Acidovorax sp. SUPP3334]
MHPEEIKAAIRMMGTTPAALADELHVSRSMVSHVINGKAKSARIASRIVEVTGHPADKLWPPKVAAPKLRRARTAGVSA